MLDGLVLLLSELKVNFPRCRLQAMKREVSMRELKLLDAVRRKFMTHQQQVKDIELQRLDDELERKVSLNFLFVHLGAKILQHWFVLLLYVLLSCQNCKIVRKLAYFFVCLLLFLST